MYQEANADGLYGSTRQTDQDTWYTLDYRMHNTPSRGRTQWYKAS
jgi:hypothetical protein